MEIYFPPGHDAKNARAAGMILFHGGGWSGGSLKQFQAACYYFASRGLVCATAEYQMLSKADKLPPAIAFFGTKDTWLAGWDAVHKNVESFGNKNIEVYFASNQAHSFFNKEPWRTQTLIEADRFLVRHQLLSGEPMLVAPLDATKLTLSRE